LGVRKYTSLPNHHLIPFFLWVGIAVPILLIRAVPNLQLQWLPENFILSIVLSGLSSLLLLALLLLRIAEAVKRGGKYLITRYDVTGAKWTRGHTSTRISSPPGAEPTNNGSGSNFWLNGIYVLVGRSLWRTDFLLVFLVRCTISLP